MNQRRMYDAIDWRNIPATADIVAGYVSGKFAWPDEAWRMFAGKPQVKMAARPWDDVGNCLLVGDNLALPVDVPDWCIKARNRGETPSVHVEASHRVEVLAACETRNVEPPLIWVRTWDDVAALPTGAIAKQYAARGVYDISVAADYWPGVDPPK